MELHPEATSVDVHYRVDRSREDWVLPEETVPESRPHDLTIDLVKALLAEWVARTGRKAQVGRNLAVRWDRAHPSVGVDPDVYVVEPPPPEGDEVESLLLWTPGHHAPLLSIEVVSASNAVKDYSISPDKYAACGTGELWVFDPKLAGPRAHGGPVRLQIWTRRPDGSFERSYAGEGPAYSPTIDAWLFAVEEGHRLRIAEDAEGTRWWMTALESERAARQAERTAKEAERTAKEAALTRIAELEAELRGRSTGT